ncbi:MAG: hypothetical protein Q8R00_04800 [Candidatus Nanoarchaeia archaeon]|nr:hypothetical protein [Candidatus Nanoarchaeia archaeon]
MPIVGFTFDKISAERQGPLKKGTEIKSDIRLNSVEEAKLSIGKKCLKINFEFIVDYTPKVGKLLLTGVIFYVTDEKSIPGIIKEWKENKKLREDISLEVLNLVLSKCNIECFSLSDKVDLPPQLPLTRMVPAKKKQPSVAK